MNRCEVCSYATTPVSRLWEATWPTNLTYTIRTQTWKSTTLWTVANGVSHYYNFVIKILPKIIWQGALTRSKVVGVYLSNCTRSKLILIGYLLWSMVKWHVLIVIRSSHVMIKLSIMNDNMPSHIQWGIGVPAKLLGLTTI